MKNKILLTLRIKFTVFLIIVCNSNVVYTQGSHYSDSTIQKTKAPDTTSKLELRKITITGNKKTKSYIILREMQVKPGDSLAITQIPAALEIARSFIYNTTLFVEVNVSSLIIGSHDFDVVVKVVERWYIFPIPVFQLADRSYNEWIEKYNASLDRVSYGLRFYHKNASGRNDQFSITLKWVYQKYFI